MSRQKGDSDQDSRDTYSVSPRVSAGRPAAPSEKAAAVLLAARLGGIGSRHTARRGSRGESASPELDSEVPGTQHFEMRNKKTYLAFANTLTQTDLPRPLTGIPWLGQRQHAGVVVGDAVFLRQLQSLLESAVGFLKNSLGTTYPRAQGRGCCGAAAGTACGRRHGFLGALHPAA